LGGQVGRAIDGLITGSYGGKMEAALKNNQYSLAAGNLLAGVAFGAGNVLTLGEGAAVAQLGTKLIAGMGGRFSKLVGTVGDDLTAHHIPQAALGFTSRAEGGAIVMPTALHELTRTFGYKGAVTAMEDAGLRFRQILFKDIRDVRSIVGSSYNQGLRDVLRYYREHFPELMSKQ
jgi:hypothetical protein